jgi:hypothetical protein
MLPTRIKKDEVLELSYRWRLTVLINELLRAENYKVYSLAKLLVVKNTMANMSYIVLAAHIDELNPKCRPENATDGEISFYKKLKSVAINRFEILRLIKCKGDENVSDELKLCILNTLNYKVVTISDIQVALILYYKLINQMLPNQTETLMGYLKDPTIPPVPMSLSNQLFGFLTLYTNGGKLLAEDVLKVLTLQRQYSLWFDEFGELKEETDIDTNTLVKLINWVPTSVFGFDVLLEDLSSVKKYVVPKTIVRVKRGIYGNSRV